MQKGTKSVAAGLLGHWVVRPLCAPPSLVLNIGDDSLLASCPLLLMTAPSATFLVARSFKLAVTCAGSSDYTASALVLAEH